MRYAIYFTPPADDALTLAAAAWLGRDAFADGKVANVTAAGFAPEELRALTADPRRYGFHGTLKAPFELAEGRTEDDLIEAFDEFCAECAAFDIPEMTLGQLGAFFALVPARQCDALQDFAAETVRRFEPFRAALSPADVARRNPDALPSRQRNNLLTWGYPYVFDDFLFHLSLTGSVPAERQPAMREALDAAFAGFIGRPLAVTGLALFIEPRRGAPFNVHTLLPLRGAPTRKIA